MTSEPENRPVPPISKGKQLVFMGRPKSTSEEHLREFAHEAFEALQAAGKTVKTNNRLRGALFGLGVGDALGAAVEFMVPGTFEPVSGYRGGGPHGLAPGEWTDDTSMALTLADSVATGEWDLNEQAARYVRW